MSMQAETSYLSHDVSLSGKRLARGDPLASELASALLNVCVSLVRACGKALGERARCAESHSHLFLLATSLCTSQPSRALLYAFLHFN